MKKTLLAMGITLAVLSIVLAGCEQLTDFGVTESIQSIQGPENVAVSAQTGALKVIWDLVTDARGYEIRRKENVSTDRYISVGTVSNAENEFLDIIANDNILVDTKVYVYQVIAVSGAATRSVVQSGVATADPFTVPAGTFPARNTVVQPVTNVQAAIATNGSVTVTWDSTNLYPVYYNVLDYDAYYGPVVEQTSDKYFSDSVYGEGYYRRSVQALWPNDYYAPSAVVSAPEQAYNIPNVGLSSYVPTPSAQRHNAYTGDTGVTIYWSPVAEATGYILQKSVTTPTINGSVVIQAGAWTTVSAEQKLVRNSTYASSVSIVVEDDVSFGSVAQYRLIVQTAKGTAGPSDPSSPVSMIDFDTSSYSPYLNVQTRTVRADDSANYLDTSVVAIVFEVYETRSGYTHSIYRQARGEPNGDGYDAKGDYELVPGIAANFEAAAGTTSTGDYDAVVKLQYNPELPRQKYSYQLRWYKDGEEVDTQNYSPLAAKSPITYYYVTSTSSAGASTNEIRWYGVESTNLSDELISVESISIYGRRDPNQPTAPVPPNQNQPSANTTLIGVAEYCDGTTAHPWPTTDALSSTPGYWVSASAYYDLSTLTAEVK